ncbi:MAG: nucleotidyltransferase [Candidatus Cloacimonadota bacterium]|nr:MAG: nucleotidyltransferase [Candidatus Cloacimonadota bacterium]PIE78502.1 MAG: nucleotidyltransferase [Candidatus Delongbacteria bacterium]
MNYNKFEKALRRLDERYQDYLKSFKRDELLESDRESIKESCIQRFETCFDTLWKHLKKYLEEEVGIVEVPNGPNPIFRLALENYLIDDYEVWYNYNRKRIGTSHDYSETKADESINILNEFIEDSIVLYEKLSGK